MKYLISALCLSLIFNIFLMGQEEPTEKSQKEILDCLVKTGNDTIRTVNICENKFLNFYFQKNKGTFDFSGKKIAFFKGNIGTIKSTKKDFFEKIKQFVHQKGFLPLSSEQLIIFNKDEVKETGYDVVIISGSKKYLTRKSVIKRLKKTDCSL